MKNYISLALVLLLGAQSLLAVDKYWRPNNSDFHVATNWDPIGVPGTGDKVILDQFGQMDMIISQSVSVAGWQQYNNYYEEVYITDGHSLTVGSQNFFMDSGGFYAGGGSMDINGHFEVHGGGFSSPETALYVQGDFEIDPYPLGGWFIDNTAHYELDGFQYGTLITSMVFPNLTINKQGGYTLTIPTGLFIRVDGYSEWLDGSINGDGLMRFAGDTYIGPGSDGGNCVIEFTGSGEQVVELDKENWNVDLIDINKNSLTDTTRFVSTIPDFQMQTSNDILRVSRGVCFIDYFNDWNLMQAETQIEPQGIFRAPSGNLNVQGNWTNNGGTFLHNQGTVTMDASRYGTFDVIGSQTFFNLTMGKDGGYAATLADGDILRVENRMNFESGYLNGLLGTLQVEDTLYFGGAHITGTCPVEVTSDKVSNVIIDEPNYLLDSFEIRKTNVADTVYFETNNALLETGAGNNRLDIHSGIVAFKDYGGLVDWDLANTQIHSGGTLLAPDGALRCAGNLTESGGTFQHNNGLWVFDTAIPRTIDVSERIDFFNLEMDKAGSYGLTISNGDSLVALNKYVSTRGFLYNSSAFIVALDSAVHTSGHQRGSTPLHFCGNGNGHWVIDEVSILHQLVSVNKDNPALEVEVSTNLAQLEMGEGDETLDIQQGKLTFGAVGTLVEMDFGNVNIQAGGSLRAHDGKTSFSGNLTELGGSFEHNMGHWEFYLAKYTSLDVSDRIEFYNVEMNRASSYALNMASGDSLVALNKYISTKGMVNNALARIIVADSLLTTASHQRGSTAIHFGGSGDGHWMNYETGQIAQDISVNKHAPGDIVWIESGNPVLQIGESDEALTIVRGQFRFLPGIDYVDLDYGNLIILADGTFEAYSGLTLARCSLLEQGGSFVHNQGTWRFDTPVYSTLDVTDRIHFWNAEMSKTGGYALTLADNDSLFTENRMTFFQGHIDNASARVVALDSTVVTNSHQRGSARLVFSGENDGTWIHDETSISFFHVDVRKENGAVVDLHASADDLDIGSSDETISIYSGTLEVNQGIGIADWGTGTTVVNGGTLALNPNLTLWTYDLTFDAGNILHRNGTVRMSNSNYATFNLTEEPLFGTFELNKTGGYSLTLSGNGRMAVEHQVEFQQGYCNSGTVVALGGADVGPSFIGGSSTLAFEGAGDQLFDLTGAASRYEGVIRLNKPSGQVILTSNLDIEDNFAQLDFISGNLTYLDPVAHSVRFLTNVSSGWTGGNDDSFIDGHAVKLGQGTTYLPLGEAGTFAPCGFAPFWPTTTGVRATYRQSPPPFGGLDPALDHISSCEYWEVIAESGTPSAQVLLSYDSDRCGPIDNPSTLAVAGWNGSGWDNLGQSGDTGYYLTSSSLPTAWQAFTLGSTNTDNPMNSSGSPCPYDIDGSGHHDTGDLLSLLGEFGCTSGCSSDITGDDAVDTADLLALLGVFGTPCP